MGGQLTHTFSISNVFNPVAASLDWACHVVATVCCLHICLESDETLPLSVHVYSDMCTCREIENMHSECKWPFHEEWKVFGFQGVGKLKIHQFHLRNASQLTVLWCSLHSCHAWDLLICAVSCSFSPQSPLQVYAEQELCTVACACEAGGVSTLWHFSLVWPLSHSIASFVLY